MSDWSLWPFYTNLDDDQGYMMTDPETLVEIFPLPEDVVKSALDWDHKFQSILTWDDPPSTPWRLLDENGYFECGRAVCRLLREHLPPDVVIDYRADGDIRPEYY
ncbi:MAG: hypothetical protein LH603_08865 [Pseudonocardia sp.]|nr:hypothetical protein [Pseudonocardia sp.]